MVTNVGAIPEPMGNDVCDRSGWMESNEPSDAVSSKNLMAGREKLFEVNSQHIRLWAPKGKCRSCQVN